MTITVKDDESLDQAIKRFMRKTDKSGILSEYRAKTSFKSKSEQEREKERQRKKKRAQKRIDR